MITLDDAIEQERKQAEIYKFEYESECDFYGTKFVDEHSGNFDCIKKMHEHEQYAEWLKELKELRANSCGYSNEDIELVRNAMYNKAIDDFVKLAKEYDFKYGNKNITHCVIGFIEFFSEQLKEHDVNEISNTSKVTIRSKKNKYPIKNIRKRKNSIFIKLVQLGKKTRI